MPLPITSAPSLCCFVQCKIVGNRNRYSMVYALFKGLAKHRGLEETAQTRGKRILTLHRGHETFAR